MTEQEAKEFVERTKALLYSVKERFPTQPFNGTENQLFSACNIIELLLEQLAAARAENDELNKDFEQLNNQKHDLFKAFSFMSRRMTEINNIVQPLWGNLRNDYMGGCQTWEQKWEADQKGGE